MFSMIGSHFFVFASFIALFSHSTQSQPTSQFDFTELTFASGVNVADSRRLEFAEGSINNFILRYSAKLVETGVVTLAPLRNWITLTCRKDGSLRIQLSDDAPVGATVQSMYPINSIIAVSREIFGECTLTDDVDLAIVESEFDRDTRTIFDDENDVFRDAYLIVEAVEGEVRDAIVRGTSTSFYALYEEADIQVDRVSPIIGRMQTSQGNSSNLGFVERQPTAVLEASIPLGALKIQAKGTAQLNAEINGFSVSWNTSGINIEFKYISEWDLSLTTEVILEVGLNPSGKSVNLLRVPISSIPPIDLSEKIKNSFFKLPPLLIGFFFEVPLIIEPKVKVQAPITNVLTTSYRTARTEHTYFLRGPWTNIVGGGSSRALSTPSRFFEFNPTIPSRLDVDIGAELFVGVRPQVIARIPIFSARVSIDFGAQLDITYDVLKTTSFPPILSNGTSTIGICDMCHDLQLNAAGLLRNAGAFVSMDLKGIKIWRVSLEAVRFFVGPSKTLAALSLPGNPTFSIPFATACFARAIGEGGTLLNFIASENLCSECPVDLPSYNPVSQACEAIPSSDPLVVSACASRPILSNGSGFSSTGRQSERDFVSALQILLNDRNDAGIDTDGLFGRGTEAAVRNWQTAQGLLVDGIVGPNTWASLCIDPLP